jgi:predicted ester cyclase
MMSIESHKALVKQFYGNYQDEDWEAAKAMCGPEYRFYHNVDTPMTADEYFAHEKQNFGTIPGFTITVVDMVGEGDKVAAYLIIESPNPALRFSLLNLIRFADGRIAEKRAHYDMRDVERQLNAQGWTPPS